MRKRLNIGLIGYGFMGKAHSNALRTLPMFFDPGAEIHLRVICGVRDEVAAAAKKYGWQRHVHDWNRVVCDPEVDIIAIASPGYTHAAIAAAAAAEGKHIFCEKPLGRSYDEARLMYEAVQENKVKHMINFNYRRVPAVLLARDLICGGRLGRIYHFKASYQQDWAVDPAVPHLWRFDQELAGAGSMADKGAHIIDLARYLVGEIVEVAGMSNIFIRERTPPAGGLPGRRVTTDDAALFTARFAGGAMGSFLTSRVAAGYKSALQFEVGGSGGCLRFDLERLNELEVYFTDEESCTRGFRRILVTGPGYEYMDRWWPAGHIIGWEHAVVHQYFEFVKAIVDDYPAEPGFDEGMINQQIIEAVAKAAAEKIWVAV